MSKSLDDRMGEGGATDVDAEFFRCRYTTQTRQSNRRGNTLQTVSGNVFHTDITNKTFKPACKRSGRPRITTPQHDRAIVHSALAYRRASAASLSGDAKRVMVRTKRRVHSERRRHDTSTLR